MKTSFIATGDYLQTRRIPSYEDEAFRKIAELIHKTDARITNLEITVSNNEGTPGPISGGTHLQTTPDRLDDLIAYGFNLVGTANNHALDYNYDGLLITKKYLHQYGILNSGSGENLYEAGKPVYLDTPTGRIALISVTSSAHLIYLATEQRRDIKGRPGVNGLRHVRKQVITKENFSVLKHIADKTEVNAIIDMLIEESFMNPLPEGFLPFGNDIYGYPMIFQLGENEGLITTPHEQDMRRLEAAIDDATRQADYVVISFHAHEMKGSNKHIPADFVMTAARRFIDAGAHAIVGHGPHTLRGVEVYKSRPIFYSLSNFIFQDETLTVLPQDFYDSNKIPNDLTVMQAMDMKTKNGTKGLLMLTDVMESVIASWTMENGKLKEITLYPIELGHGKKRHQNGFPEITKNEEILKRLQVLSEPFGTEIIINDGVGKIQITK